jgi:hypothetical protein
LNKDGNEELLQNLKTLLRSEQWWMDNIERIYRNAKRIHGRPSSKIQRKECITSVHLKISRRTSDEAEIIVRCMNDFLDTNLPGAKRCESTFVASDQKKRISHVSILKHYTSK